MDIIDELKKQAFRNAIRLFRDSCLLAIHGSYESSYAIAVLSYEEIGKAAIADRQLDRVCLNPGSDQYAKETLLACLKDHTVKQMWAAFDSGSEGKYLHKGLDVEKQNALYVNYDGNKVTSPNISKEKLQSLISEVYRALNGVGELPYYGIAGISSEKSKWQVEMDIQSVSEIYEKAISL